MSNKRQLAIEVLEERIALSALPGILPSSIYLNPTFLTFAAEPAAVQTTQDLAVLKQKYGFGAQASTGLDWQNYVWSWGGLKEKWIKAGDGTWSFLLPQGDLYRWQ